MQRGNHHINGGNGAHDRLAADAFDFQVSGVLPVKRQTNRINEGKRHKGSGAERLTIPGIEGGWLLKNGGQLSFF